MMRELGGTDCAKSKILWVHVLASPDTVSSIRILSDLSAFSCWSSCLLLIQVCHALTCNVHQQFMCDRTSASASEVHLHADIFKQDPCPALDLAGSDGSFNAGKIVPLQQKQVILTTGPGGDGAVCTVAFTDVGMERLQKSCILQQLAPESAFVRHLK